LTQSDKWHEEPDMLEAHYLNNLWRMLVSCVLLNRTKREQVDRVIFILFVHYPNAQSMRSAREDQVAEILKPLGFQNRRAKTLVKMSDQYVMQGVNPFSPSIDDLSGVGTFAKEAYRIFFLNDIEFQPTDKELKSYVAWRRARDLQPWGNRINCRDPMVRLKAYYEKLRELRREEDSPWNIQWRRELLYLMKHIGGGWNVVRFGKASVYEAG
jgi:hypothetical protein